MTDHEDQEPNIVIENGITFFVNERGFKSLAPLDCAYGETIHVRESSSAMEPHLWLDVEVPNDLNAAMMGDLSDGTHRATAHLSAEQAWALKKQLEWALEHHYHGDARPEHARL